ncbi:hypothetical protein GALL_549650 [mine drainage metagenome]|uniref:Uncharacterized protein n=1 Tax=mine drainage metagenome TaxID=410659 RepID=A0A1J5P6S4_9ZZZZ
MHFRISRHLDVEPVAGFAADEFNQFIGITEFAGTRHARGQIAAQRDDVADIVALVFFQYRTDIVAGGTDAGQVRRGFQPGVLDVEHRSQGVIARRPAGTEGHRKELGVQFGELAAHDAQLVHAVRRLGRKKLKTVGTCNHRNAPQVIAA